MTTVTFLGGVREIGHTIILVETERARVLLDCGLPIPDGGGLLAPPLVERPSPQRAADRLAIGMLASFGSFLDPDQLPTGHPAAAQPDGRDEACFLSHPHLDHDGALSFLRPELPVWAHPDAVAVQAAALAVEPERVPGENRRTAQPLRLLDPDHAQPVAVGDVLVQAIRVEHDVPGACGYRVETPDGVLAYTGDINLHRGPRTWAFGEAVRGAELLVLESTLLSFPEPEEGWRPMQTEAEVAAELARVLARTPGLALLSVYERDVDRCRSFMETAASAGRTLLWPERMAGFLRRLGVDATAYGDVAPAAVADDPSGYLVQTDARSIPSLLDWPITPGTPWIHAQGEPLGPFMAEWPVWAAWLARLGVETVPVGCSGHAAVADLERLAAHVAPRAVVPIHTWRPEEFSWSGRTLVVERDVAYGLDGSPA